LDEGDVATVIDRLSHLRKEEQELNSLINSLEYLYNHFMNTLGGVERRVSHPQKITKALFYLRINYSRKFKKDCEVNKEDLSCVSDCLQILYTQRATIRDEIKKTLRGLDDMSMSDNPRRISYG
jgi:hypothetical protein